MRALPVGFERLPPVAETKERRSWAAACLGASEAKRSWRRAPQQELSHSRATEGILRVPIIIAAAHPLRLTAVRHLPFARRGGFTHCTKMDSLEVSRGAVARKRDGEVFNINGKPRCSVKTPGLHAARGIRQT